jgi:hypothetical protein
MKSKVWLKSTAALQLITGGIHAISLFSKLQPTNDTEKQLVELMDGYKMQMGAGFEPTMADFFLALSSCFTLLYLFGGAINFYLLKHDLSDAAWKGLVLTQVVFFGVSFILMSSLTFLPPIVLTGLVFALLIISYFKSFAEE